MDVISETPELINSILKRFEYIVNAWVDVVLAESHNFQTIHKFYFNLFYFLFVYYCYDNIIIDDWFFLLEIEKKSSVQTPNGRHVNTVKVN